MKMATHRKKHTIVGALMIIGASHILADARRGESDQRTFDSPDFPDVDEGILLEDSIL